MLSPDDVARASLIRTSDLYFWGLVWSTIGLLIGAVMEYWEPLERLPTHNVNTRTRLRTPRIWVIRSQEWWKRLAIALVVLGIAGEGFFEYRGAIAETAVRKFDEGITVQAETDAVEANDRATAAVRELIRLKTPRSISPAGRTRVEQRLARFSIRPVAVTFLPSSFDAESLAVQLCSILPGKGTPVPAGCGPRPDEMNSSEWFVLYGLNLPSPFVSGIEVIYTDESGRPLAKTIASALAHECLESHIEYKKQSPKRPDGIVVVRVGAIPVDSSLCANSPPLAP